MMPMSHWYALAAILNGRLHLWLRTLTGVVIAWGTLCIIGALIVAYEVGNAQEGE